LACLHSAHHSGSAASKNDDIKITLRIIHGRSFSMIGGEIGLRSLKYLTNI
jgi:hypothetical protein